uniref:EOG090X04ZD n=1 Tax=Evadne anonyx TaxID=141404 RepID=A0A9N6WRY2_9CRUS|nr:EOG090X04ZD [Evadne anonyx]
MAATTRKRDSKHAHREVFEIVKSKTKDIIQSRKNANLIIDIFSYLENDEASVVLVSIKALDKVFCHFISKGYLLEKGPAAESDAEKCLREWSRERYFEFQERLLSLIAAEQISIQEHSLVTLMNLLKTEGLHPLVEVEGKPNQFPLGLLEKLMVQMLNLETESTPVLTRFQEFIEYEDVLFHLLRTLGSILKAKTDVNQKFMKNLIGLLENITLNDNKKPSDAEKQKLFCCNEKHFSWNYGQAKKFFSVIWTQVLKYPLTPSLYKRVLVLLPEKVMPHLEKPLLLTDFLMASYAVGGSISILALNGVFLLMQNHHLEYPDFYTKLYALLEPSVLFVKYRPRFFYLLDIFMTSTHVPEYIAAAFVKRLSRLALIAPPNVTMLLLHSIGNFILRHRGLVKMSHNTENQTDVTDDPYLMEESNMTACNALDSSLWEIKTLQSHVLPEIAYAAKFIDRDLPRMEWDISQDLELSIEDMLEKEMKRKHSDDTPLNFERPTKFACVNHDRLSQYFDFA